jgi:very-short-patch-repair endonuclease/DNA polymerase III delta prime subunit
VSEQLRSKVRQLYRFLKKANELRFKPVRTLADQEKFIRFAEIPLHPTLQIQRPIRAIDENQNRQDFVLRVKRPVLTPCPKPPQDLIEWLIPGYEDPNQKVTVAQSRNVMVIRAFNDAPQRVKDFEAFCKLRKDNPLEQPPSSIARWLKDGWNTPNHLVGVNEQLTLTETVSFIDDSERVLSLEQWTGDRNRWIEPELAARQAMVFYERIYDLYITLEKRGENIELMVADGRLQWLATSELEGQVKIDHPVLLKRVELRFNPDVPEFTISDTEREPELYTSLFIDLAEVLPVAIRSRNEELEKIGYHPLAFEGTAAFLRGFIQTISPTSGEYFEEDPQGPITATPRLYRDPVIVLRERSHGIAKAVNSIIEAIETKQTFPPALAQITGVESGWGISGLGDQVPPSEAMIASIATIYDDEILLGKEANAEQMQILKRLQRSGSVIVQGPPGTGKTHTIGNLIGHLLAQGKSILVTAQTAKALRVVRDKVPEMLRPLAVAVLGNDSCERGQLETAIGSITERMTSDSADTLLAKAKAYEQDRERILAQKKALKVKLRRALENEYREIQVWPRTFTPSQAARYVRDNKSAHSWVPGPVKTGASLTLTEEEIMRAHSLGRQFTPAEAIDCVMPLPLLSNLPAAAKFKSMVDEYQSVLTIDLRKGQDRWIQKAGSTETLVAIITKLELEFSDDLRTQTWRPHAILASQYGDSTKMVWLKLMELIATCNEAHAQYALCIHHNPRISQTMPLAVQLAVVTQICDHLGNSGKLGFLQLMTRAEWKQFIKESKVAAGEPTHKDHFEALRTLIQLDSSRQQLQPLWDMLIGERINKIFASLGNNPEQSCRAVVPEIHRCLSWHTNAWMPIEASLNGEGLRLSEILDNIPREASAVSGYIVLEKLATTILPELLVAELARRRLRECEEAFDAIERLVTPPNDNTALTGCICLIIGALRAHNPAAYEEALIYLQRLQSIKPLVVERKRLLDQLALVAPVWSETISGRIKPYDTDITSTDIDSAWTWRQLHDELAERDTLNGNQIQLEIDKLEVSIREVTLLLIDAKAWGNQLDRLRANNSIRQALVGWLDTMKVLSSTRQDARRQVLLSEARKLMKRSSDAVPVWVMPISLVAENFDPGNITFDVVIIDEASQADLNALIPLFMGKQVIIVGDHEQVTPLGVGKSQTILENIRQQTLTDIPNSHLFDSKYSIYDIGRSAFGDAIRLVEHFRCVPEIIAFSNQLSYDGKIRPLRASNSSDLKPACVSINVNGLRNRDVNLIEAQRIVDLIRAMIKHPRYVAKTIGVITMLGELQTHMLQSMILKVIPAKAIEERRITVGNSSEFQGDERDVILLSMVDSPQNQGPMRLVGEGAFELIKKRYNVATSRARDQLIVVHSFDPDIHLQANDIRLRLMRHIADPLVSLRAFQQAVGRTESVFERAVLKILTEAGYKVKTQWEVGYYRIDMVVVGGDKRLAIECDGDRYHPIDKLDEDIARQTVLERLGWQFVRIRGTAFYRDAESSMQPVFERLRELEIPLEADADLPPENDMSLLHELENLIAKNHAEDPLLQQEAPTITVSI